MAPSRGFNPLMRLFSSFNAPKVRQYSDFTQAVSHPANQYQIYISRSLDPYLNLSIEHYLLQKTPAESTILFLYTNTKSVIIGRNQNPWVETHISSLKHKYNTVLVRRRSGGGTVFHDEGNVNYSVICPTPAFNRDKHAQMVVRALQKLGVEKARVNERHDIVMDFIGTGHQDDRPLKVSGSAYKLTRLRSLHHGTCLLSSPNLKNISQMLWSPAKRYIKARGVESVSSPVANVELSNSDFEDAVVAEFGSLYEAREPIILDGEMERIPEIERGVEELESPEWIYSQTPQFTLSTQHNEYELSKDSQKGAWDHLPEVPEEVRTLRTLRLDLLADCLQFNAHLTVRNGKVTEAELKFGGHLTDQQEDHIKKSLLNETLHEIHDWESLLGSKKRHAKAGAWMNVMLGIPK